MKNLSSSVPKKISIKIISSELVYSIYPVRSRGYLLPQTLSYLGDYTRITFVPKGREWIPGIDLGDSIMSSTRNLVPWSSAEIEYLIRKRGFAQARTAIYYLMNLELVTRVSGGRHGKI